MIQRHLAWIIALLSIAMMSCQTKSQNIAKSEVLINPTTPTSTPDLKNGATIAQQGTQKGVAACIACHGANGEGMASGGFPALAGQWQMYIVSQLADYASGTRDNEVMKPIAKALSEQERLDVAAYYQSLPVAMSSAKPSRSALIKRGEILANIGDQKIQVQACNNCHGPGGVGLAPLIPRLAGQYAAYTENQLLAWKQGVRKNNPEQMLQVALQLRPAEIKAVAAYYAQIAPPKKKQE